MDVYTRGLPCWFWWGTKAGVGVAGSAGSGREIEKPSGAELASVCGGIERYSLLASSCSTFSVV